MTKQKKFVLTDKTVCDTASYINNLIREADRIDVDRDLYIQRACIILAETLIEGTFIDYDIENTTF